MSGKGYTPIMNALKHNPSPELIQAFIDHGADMNAEDEEGNTPLMIALMRGCPLEIIHTIIRGGTKTNMKNGDGETPLMIALKKEYQGSPEVIQTLIKNGANVNEEGMQALIELAIQEHAYVVNDINEGQWHTYDLFTSSPSLLSMSDSLKTKSPHSQSDQNGKKEEYLNKTVNF